MANAKRCDICGEYYTSVGSDLRDDFWDERRNTSMVRLLRRTDDERNVDHAVFHFDACEKCFQDVMDYVLAKKSMWDTIAK